MVSFLKEDNNINGLECFIVIGGTGYKVNNDQDIPFQ